MTYPAQTLVTESDVRAVIELNAAATSKYSSDTISSNIRAASFTLQRRTGRLFFDQAFAYTATTNGDLVVPLPGFRSVTSVTRAGAALVADSSYYLIPDTQNTGAYTAIQFGAFQYRGDGPAYLHNPNWFDQNLDSPKYWGRSLTSLPNDLVVVGTAGYTDATMPEPIKRAAKVQAAIYTLRSEGIIVPDLEAEVDAFVREWSVGRQAVGV